MKSSDILAIDVGNTSIFFAHCCGNKILKTYRIPTNGFSHLDKKIFNLKNCDAAVIASVVPSATNILLKEIPKKWHLRVFLIGKDIAVPIKNKYKDPRQVGMDRLMNAVAAFNDYRRDLIIVDFGTAITFDVVSKKGEYLGGVIAPGIEISLEALFFKTAMLPKIRLAHPNRFIGQNTVESIRIGCSVGIGGLCDRIIQNIKERGFATPLVIATGGYAKFMRKYCHSIDKIDELLVIKGILSCYEAFKKNLDKKKL